MLMLYQEQMSSIADYIETIIADDDMAECAKTWTESEKYKETRIFFDSFSDNYPGLHMVCNTWN